MVCSRASSEGQPAEPSDDELMERTRAGEEAAFERLVRRHQHHILRLAACWLKDDTLAVDVAQNAFLELYRSRHRYQSRGKFVPYLTKIAINQCRMARRRATRDRNLVQEGLAHQASADPQAKRALLCALAQLSSKLRDVVILRYVEDLTLAEAAEQLALPLGTVKSRLFEARAQLRRSVAEPA